MLRGYLEEVGFNKFRRARVYVKKTEHINILIRIYEGFDQKSCEYRVEPYSIGASGQKLTSKRCVLLASRLQRSYAVSAGLINI